MKKFHQFVQSAINRNKGLQKNFLRIDVEFQLNMHHVIKIIKSSPKITT